MAAPTSICKGSNIPLPTESRPYTAPKLPVRKAPMSVVEVSSAAAWELTLRSTTLEVAVARQMRTYAAAAAVAHNSTARAAMSVR